MGDVNADIRQLYDSDPRPTFIVDCEAPSTTIYHVNTALLAIPHVALSIASHNALRDWWDPVSRVASRSQTEFCHGRYRWAKFAPCNRWLVVTILQQPPPSLQRSNSLPETAKLSRIASPLLGPQPDTIFTVKIQSPELRQHIEHVRNFDWSKTSLGPISTWGYELNVLVTTLMLDTRPTALFLGPERTILYNLAYGAVSGSRHPAILGQSILDAWPEIADPISATVARSEQTRFADVPEEEYHFMVERYGFVEESFFKWSLVPLVGVGNVIGMYSIVTEVTKQRLLERRVNALLRVGQLASKARTTKQFWAQVGQAIRLYEYDFPAAILYSQWEPESSEFLDAQHKSPGRCALEWTIGYRPDHPDIPQHLHLNEDIGLASAFSTSAKDGPAMLYKKQDGILPMSLYTDLENRGFGDPLKAFLVLPIRTYDENVVGYFLVGLNTRRPYDDEYKDWIHVLSNLLGASAALVALHEEEAKTRKRQEEQAARDRAALNAEVATLAQEASDAVEKLRNFHEIADQVGLGYFEIDVHGSLLHANETYLVQTGHRRDFVHSPPFAFKDYIHEDDIAMVEDRWRTLVAGEPATFEVRWKKQSSQEQGERPADDCLWTLSACVPIKGPDGLVTSIFGCNTDISAQKEATKAVVMRSEAERRLASFTELAPVGLYHLNADLSMRYCNDQWFRITGHPKVAMDQVDWRNIVEEDVVEACYRDVSMTKCRKGPQTFSIHLKKKWKGPDGVVMSTWILVTATAHTDGTIMGTMTDISQLKWAEAIQKTRVEEALESKRQQENFIDMTSHEMRNPLSAMVQCADSITGSLGEMKSLLRGKLVTTLQPTQEAQLEDLIDNSLDAIDTIQACATHQKRIVDDILTLSKLDSKLLVISPIVLRPVTILQDAYKMFKDEAHKVGVDLEVRCDPSIAELEIDWAILDPSRVLQILINLLTNAMKFTQGQEVRKVEVIMGASRGAEKMPGIEYVPQETSRRDFLIEPEHDHAGEVFYLNFTVKDTGCGLSPEHKAKLFLRFSQATPKTHVQYGGSGLGLFISRELSELQGGSIGVCSDQNLGSTFSFYIKSRRAPPPPGTCPGTDLGTNLDNEATTRSNADIIRDMNGSHEAAVSDALFLPKAEQMMASHRRHYDILVVEDNLINQRVLSAQLKKLGHNVHVANHGAEALSHLSQTAFSAAPTASPPIPLSVVLMDIEMPVMDGLTCTQKIRAMEAEGELNGHVPVVAVSANARREQVERATTAGVDDAICKPFHVSELMALIERLGIPTG